MQVFGFRRIEGDIDVAAKAIAVNKVDYSDEHEFFTQFQEQLGLDVAEGMLMKVHGDFNIDFLDMGMYTFTVTSSDGAVLYIDGEYDIEHSSPLTLSTHSQASRWWPMMGSTALSQCLATCTSTLDPIRSPCCTSSATTAHRFFGCCGAAAPTRSSAAHLS